MKRLAWAIKCFIVVMFVVWVLGIIVLEYIGPVGSSGPWVVGGIVFIPLPTAIGCGILKVIVPSEQRK